MTLVLVVLHHPLFPKRNLLAVGSEEAESRKPPIHAIVEERKHISRGGSGLYPLW
jgi:hypothetical protein